MFETARTQKERGRGRSRALQFVKNLRRIKSARDRAGELEGGSPPRVGSNALNALLGKAFSERSEDFPAAQRRQSIGIFAGCRKSLWTFLTA